MTAIAGRRAPLDQVLDEFAALPEPPDAATVRKWVGQYPEYKREIIAFAADWVAMDAAGGHPVADEQVDRVVNRTMSRAQSLLDRAPEAEALTDLGGAMRAAGYDEHSLPRLIGIDRSIWDSVSLRLAIPRSIPGVLVRELSEALRVSSDALRYFLLLPPRIAGAHKAKAKPVAAQVDFAVLVNASHLTNQEKERWIREPPDPGLQK